MPATAVVCLGISSSLVMSNLSHPMIRRSERGPRADTDGGKDPSIGSSAPPYEMESHLTSSETTTESQSTDSSDELIEPVAVEMSPSVSGSPGVEMGVSGNAIPVPEVEPEDPEVNTCLMIGASTRDRECPCLSVRSLSPCMAKCTRPRRPESPFL